MLCYAPRPQDAYIFIMQKDNCALIGLDGAIVPGSCQHYPKAAVKIFVSKLKWAEKEGR